MKVMECVNKLKNFTHSMFIVSARLQSLRCWIFSRKRSLYEDKMQKTQAASTRVKADVFVSSAV